MRIIQKFVRFVLIHRIAVASSLLVAALIVGGIAASAFSGLPAVPLWVLTVLLFVAAAGLFAVGVRRVRETAWRIAVVLPRERSARRAREGREAERTRQRNARIEARARAALAAAGRPASAGAVDDEPRRRVASLIAEEAILDAWDAACEDDVRGRLSRGELVAIVRGLKKRGYLVKAEEGAQVLRARFGHAADRTLHDHLKGEIAVLGGRVEVEVDARDASRPPVPGRILHVVGASLPDQQSGYTLRTHYTAQAQIEAGLEPHVVTQMGFGDAEEYSTVEIDGVSYHRCPGAKRGTGALDSWFEQNVRRVSAVARKVRPSVLHAASDLINARTALIVGRAYGIPVVYESRGFWEETWLQREADRYGWDLDSLTASYGLPDVYTLRRETEDECRRSADAVVTLASVMADRIVEGGVGRRAVSVIPNGVNADRFPILSRDPELAGSLQVDHQTVTIGYVSSLVDYEGVDLLVEAVAEVRALKPGTPVRLVVVGDGPEREALEDLARRVGLDDAIFTGQVPHEKVLAYYSLIDIFVVPRRPVEVCQLVTPLKPFEALSSARALVMSDVRALREIAETSGAAVLFEAGSVSSLSAALSRLVGDPDERAALGTRGAEWVRRERTWGGNARRYVEVYESLGVVPPGAGEMIELVSAQPDRNQLGGLLTARGPVPFSSSVDLDKRLARPMLEDGWVFHPHPPVVFDGSPIDWDTLCRTNRTWEFRLHAWDFMAPVLRDYERNGDAEYLDWCRDIALSWVRRFTQGDAGGTMAWYDMSLGLRAPRLAYLIEALFLREEPWENIVELLGSVPRHQREFFADAAFNPRTNHGFYTAAGQLMFSRRLAGMRGMDVMEDQANERMAVVARTQFAADGGHLEHSPDYHRMLLGSFSTALASGLIVDAEIQTRVRKAEEALGWMIQPDGRLIQIGDSPARVMLKERTTIENETTAFIVSGGKKGKPSAESIRVLPDSGYVFVRHPFPTAESDHRASSYLAFMAGFHSRAHKHADDLSFTWFDRGREILIDAGRYGYVDLLPQDSPQRLDGYYYGAPQRQFVESTRAHNTVEADGRDHVRRGRAPYGSAVREARQEGAHFLIRGFVEHKGWTHERTLILSPGEWLLVEDRVVGKHTYRSWLNLPSDLEPEEVAPGRLKVRWGTGGESLWIEELSGAASIAPVIGGAGPLRGWRSEEDLSFEPSWSTGFATPKVGRHTFRTLLHFGESPLGEVPQHPFTDTVG